MEARREKLPTGRVVTPVPSLQATLRGLLRVVAHPARAAPRNPGREMEPMRRGRPWPWPFHSARAGERTWRACHRRRRLPLSVRVVTVDPTVA